MCGESHWKAAKASSKGMANLDETCLCMACCRHSILYKAVNMHQGEIFAYPLFLHMALLKEKNTFFCQVHSMYLYVNRYFYTINISYALQVSLIYSQNTDSQNI